MRQRLSYVITVVLLALAIVPSAQAQTRPVTGRVVNPTSSEPISGALVSIVGGGASAQTDQEGRFRIALPATDATILVRAIGFKRAEVRVPATATTTVVNMERDVLRLDELVVTGQATTVERKNSATAVSTVNAEELTRVPAASLENALQGKVVGAKINLNSGAPGGGGQIQIRGVTTILGNGQPLYVVDGVIISNAQIQSGANTITSAGGGINGSQDNATNRLADINPADIENVEVLKGASAAAIYGSRATNGVVVITTKRGSQGSARFQVSQKLGTFESFRLTGSRQFQNKADALTAATSVVGAANAQRLVDSLYAAHPNPYYDYQKDLYGRRDLSYETNASLSGGTDATKYFLSGTTKRDGGTLLNTDAKRDAIRLNLDQSLGRITISAGATFTRSLSNRGLSNNDNSNTSPLYNFAYTPSIIDLQTRDANGNYPQNPFPGGGGRNSSNPFATLAYIVNREDVYRQIASLRANWNAFTAEKASLVVSAAGGVDRFDQQNNIYEPNFLQQEGRDGFFGRAAQGASGSRQMNGSLTGVLTWTPGGRLPFQARTSGGLSQEEQDLNTYFIQARGLLPGLQNVDQGTRTTSQQRTRTVDQAVYAQEEILALDERLLLSAAFRADRSSANGNRDKFFVFPKGAASYNFVAPFSGVDRFKLRAAVGQSGNRPNYGNRDVILNQSGRIGGRDGIGAATTLGNPNIEPEKMTEQEYGIDGSFLKERLGLELTRFDRKISNMLLLAPLAASTGLTQQYFNGGKLSTKGWEAAATLSPFRNFHGVGWVSRTTYYTVNQQVTDLPVPRFIVGSSGFGTAYGRSRIACYRTAENKPCAGSTSATAIWGNAPIGAPLTAGGAPTVVDTIIGEATPKFEMSFNNDFSWKAVNLSVLFDWRKGGDVSNMTQALFDEGQNSRDYDAPSPCRSNAALTGCATTALPAGDPNKKLGAYRYDKWNGGKDARVYVQDGSFVKLREITLSVAVPAQIVKRLPGGTRDIRLNVSGRNLYTWTKYWSPDPEVNNFGNQNVSRFVDLAPYPPSRSFFFGFDLGW